MVIKLLVNESELKRMVAGEEFGGYFTSCNDMVKVKPDTEIYVHPEDIKEVNRNHAVIKKREK